MRFMIGGKTAAQDVIKLFKAADAKLIPILVMADNGAPFDLTSHTVSLDLHSGEARTDTPSKTLSVTLVTAADGLAQITPVIATIDFGPGTYKAYLRTVNAGVITVSDNYVTIKVG